MVKVNGGSHSNLKRAGTQLNDQRQYPLYDRRPHPELFGSLVNDHAFRQISRSGGWDSRECARFPPIFFNSDQSRHPMLHRCAIAIIGFALSGDERQVGIARGFPDGVSCRRVDAPRRDTPMQAEINRPVSCRSERWLSSGNQSHAHEIITIRIDFPV